MFQFRHLLVFQIIRTEVLESFPLISILFLTFNYRGGSIIEIDFFLSVKSKCYKKDNSNEYTGSGQKEAKHIKDKIENVKTTYTLTM